MKTLFIAPTRNGVGLSSTALGVARALERQGLKVAFLKPIAQTHDRSADDSVHFGRTVAHLTPPDPIDLTRAEEMLSHGAEEELMEQVIALAREKAKACGQIAATVRKVATMVPAPKAAKSQQPLDVIEGVVGRLDKATKASEPDARPAAAQAVAMRAALRKLGRR